MASHHHHSHGDHHHHAHGDGAAAGGGTWIGEDGRVWHSHDGLAPHSHEPIYSPGDFTKRAPPLASRSFADRAFTVGIGGPVGTGKTALMLALCKFLRDKYSLAAVTNDIFTKEDGEFLIKHGALPEERIRAVETGGCPHAAIREDISINLGPLEELSNLYKADLLLCESGGDNLAANFSRELADYIIYIIDVSGGDKIPRKGGPGITQAGLIQPVDFQYDGKVYTCRVHDMILGFIVRKAVEENFVTVLTDRKQMLASQDKVHRLSIDCHGQENLTTFPIATTHVRSLNIFRYSEQIPPLSCFGALRVLDLDGNDNLQKCYLEDIGKLFHLRYLRIRASNIALPKQIGELQSLVTLDLLSCTGLGELPASIIKLRHLKWLITPPVNLPDGIGNLQALEFLSLIVVDYRTSVTSLQELSGLSKLRTLRLEWRISPVHNDKNTYMDNLLSSLHKLGSSSLRYLTVINPWSLDFLFDFWSSQPPHLLQELEVKGWHLNKMPVLMASLTNLTYIDIEVKVTQETLQILGDFPSLLFVKLYSNCAGPVERCLVISSNGFQCLKKFSFAGWVNMMFEEGAMPVLETLEYQIIAQGAKTKYGFNPPDLGVRHLLTLRNLVANVHCEGASAEEVERVEAAIQIAAGMLPKHPTLTLHRFLESEMVKS